jgi:hypothetical protein
MWPLHATRNRHLSEDRLIEAALAAQSDPFVPAPTDQTIHLRACADCAARYEEIAAFLDNLAVNVNADFDTVFTAERLLAQRQKISRRLSRLLGLDPRARVLRFPSSGPPLPHAGASARRWMAAAAVACLVLGVVAGRLIPFPPAFRDQPTAASGPTNPAVVATDLGEPTSYGAEDDFLVEIEAALGSPRIYELRAIDAMTPRIREVAVNIR